MLSPTVQRHEGTFSARSALKVKAKTDLRNVKTVNNVKVDRSSKNERESMIEQCKLNMKGTYRSSPKEKEKVLLYRDEGTRNNSSSSDEEPESYSIDLIAKHHLLGTLRNGREVILSNAVFFLFTNGVTTKLNLYDP